MSVRDESGVLVSGTQMPMVRASSVPTGTPSDRIKLVLERQSPFFSKLNAVIFPNDLPEEKIIVAQAIAIAAGLVHDLMLSRAWSKPDRPVLVWCDYQWGLALQKLHSIAPLPFPTTTDIIVP